MRPGNGSEKGRWKRLFTTGLIAALILGFGVTHQRAQERLDEALPSALEGVDIVVTGTVASLPREGPCRAAAALDDRSLMTITCS